MNFETKLFLFTTGLFVGMIVLLEAGRRMGRKKYLIDPEGYEKGHGTIDGAVFGLLGLLIAFTFSGAASRFEGRRELVTQEANAIGTAYLRVDLLPSSAQPEMRELFRRYVDSRISIFENPKDAAGIKNNYALSASLQNDIWKHAVSACQAQDGAVDACKLLLPALNEMIDITTTRIMATRNHPPMVIYLLMAMMCLLSALLAGYGLAGNKSIRHVHMVTFAFIMAVVFYVIFDLEYPRMGLIKVSNADLVLKELRESM